MSNDPQQKLSDTVRDLQIEAAKGFATTKQHLDLVAKQIEKLDLEIEVLRNTLTHGDDSINVQLALLKSQQRRIDWFAKTAIGMSGSLIVGLIVLAVKNLVLG